jgi:uracil phosphoribosyltransferase
METVPNASVGILGIERTEDNSGVREYYKKFPTTKAQNVIILDPMLATGNSAILAVDFIKRMGYESKQIYFAGILASKEGFERLAESIPRENITLTAVDPELNDKKYIVPGLGDYGDRYFGTNH